MSLVCIMGAVFYVLALICGVLSRRWPALSWMACIIGIVSAGLMLYDGASLEMLSVGAMGLALPLLPFGRSTEQEGI